MTDLAQLEREIFMTNEGSAMERLLELRSALKFIKAAIKEREDEFEEVALAWIAVNGPIVCGDIELRAGIRKETKCVDVPGAVDALFQAVGGDMRRFCEHLSSGAIKHGTSKATLAPELYDKLFVIEERPKIVEGKAAKELIETNLHFAKRGGS